MEVYEDAGDPGGNKRQAVQAGFLEEAALESNLKGARPTRQRERVPVSIPTSARAFPACTRALLSGAPYSAPRSASDILAWRIPGTGEPGGLPSMGSYRVGHD